MTFKGPFQTKLHWGFMILFCYVAVEGSSLPSFKSSLVCAVSQWRDEHTMPQTGTRLRWPPISILSQLQAIYLYAAAGNSVSVGFAGKSQTLPQFYGTREEVSSQQGSWVNPIFRFQSVYITGSEVLPSGWHLTIRQSLLPRDFPQHSQSPRIRRKYHPPRNNSLSFQNIWECFLMLWNESRKCFLFLAEVKVCHLYFYVYSQCSAVIVV